MATLDCVDRGPGQCRHAASTGCWLHGCGRERPWRSRLQAALYSVQGCCTVTVTNVAIVHCCATACGQWSYPVVIKLDGGDCLLCWLQVTCRQRGQ